MVHFKILFTKSISNIPYPPQASDVLQILHWASVIQDPREPRRKKSNLLRRPRRGANLETIKLCIRLPLHYAGLSRSVIQDSREPRKQSDLLRRPRRGVWLPGQVVLAPGDRSLSCGKNVECWKRGTAGVACTGQESPGVRDPARARNCWRPTTVSETRLYSFVVGTAQSCSIGASAGQ